MEKKAPRTRNLFQFNVDLSILRITITIIRRSSTDIILYGNSSTYLQICIWKELNIVW